MSLKPLEFEAPIVELQTKIAELRDRSEKGGVDLSEEIAQMEQKLEQTSQKVYAELTPWQRVQIARHPARPFFLDYVSFFDPNWIELHGDRHIGDDHSMPAGMASIGQHRCVVVGHQKGRNTEENLLRNFGSAHPEGYRKALRMMKLAEKFSLPVVAFIDTPGAFPGIGAEERNIAEAIAFNLREMARINVPVVAVVLGEGGSGGALGIGVADRVLMLENAYYSVISPEGCAAILWKHRKHAPEAAEAMKLAAPDLIKLGLIDGVVEEPQGGAHHDHQAVAGQVEQAITRALDELTQLSVPQLRKERKAKFRSFGAFADAK